MGKGKKKKVQQTTFLCQTQKLLSILISFKMFLVNTFLFLPAKLSALIFTGMTVFNIFPYRSTAKQVQFSSMVTAEFPSLLKLQQSDSLSWLRWTFIISISIQCNTLVSQAQLLHCVTVLNTQLPQPTPGRTASWKPCRTTYVFSTRHKLQRFKRTALHFLAS